MCVLQLSWGHIGTCILGDAEVINKRALVTVNGLECGVMYTVVAGGTLNGDMIGPRRLVANINTTTTCSEVNVTSNNFQG